MVAIKIWQEWKRWAFMPPNLHVWKMFIKPDEVKGLLQKNGLDWREHKGPSPNHFEPAKTYQRALFEAGIPYTLFNVDNVQQEYERLVHLGVEFSVKPTEVGTVKIAVFDDTCGNNIQIVEML